MLVEHQQLSAPNQTTNSHVITFFACTKPSRHQQITNLPKLFNFED